MGKVSAYPLGEGECCNISTIKMFKKQCIQSYIVYSMCAMKFAFMICSKGQSQTHVTLFNQKLFLFFVAYSILGSAVLCFLWFLVLHLECLIIDAYFNSISF